MYHLLCTDNDKYILVYSSTQRFQAEVQTDAQSLLTTLNTAKNTDHELRTGVTEADAMSALDLIIGGGVKHLMKICSFLTVSFPQS